MEFGIWSRKMMYLRGAEADVDAAVPTEPIHSINFIFILISHYNSNELYSKVQRLITSTSVRIDQFSFNL